MTKCKVGNKVIINLEFYYSFKGYVKDYIDKRTIFTIKEVWDNCLLHKPNMYTLKEDSEFIYWSKEYLTSVLLDKKFIDLSILV